MAGVPTEYGTVGFADTDPYSNKDSVEFRFRARRFQQIQKLIQSILDERGQAEIVDLGGTETYWLVGEEFIRRNGDRIRITIVNTEPQTVKRLDIFTAVQQSATDSGLFADRGFDLVHSNSVVEHVGGWLDMVAFAQNVRRLAPRYYVQTPNYWFPYEPHFRFPGFQFLPERVRIALIRNFAFGFFPRIPDRREAADTIHHHRLISTRQMRELFPDAEIGHEKFMGLNKSIIAMRDVAPSAS